jgi:hypothetical protein
VEPGHLKFGGGVAATVLHPAVLALTLVAGILICIWPQKKALAAFLTAAILIPMDQVLLIGPAHFPMLRLLVLFGIVRMVRGKAGSKAKIFSGGLNKIDIFTILLTIFIAVNGILLFQASGEVINQLGNVYTVFGAYFLLRFLIRDEEDVLHAMRTLAWVAAFVAVVMTYEVMTGHNPYAMLGGARAFVYSSLAARDDRFRAQGPFGHSILAGTFGAIVMPLFVALWWKGRKYRKLAVVGVVSATVIVLSSNSSTPVLGYAAGMVALCMWPIRQRMQMMRWGIVLILVSLHMVMKAPVWNLIARIDITGGSSGWHRYMLIDQCIHHFWDWWLIGVKDTSAWGWDMWDTANQYVATCDNSGLLPFIFFVAVLVYGFKYLGRARRAASRDKKRALFIWAMGAALFANVVSFIGISYFDQTEVVWYCFLAMIPVVALAQRKKELKPVEPEVLPETTNLVETETEMTWPLAEESVRTSSL